MTDDDLITSAANPLIKRVRSLTGERRRERSFYCEGVQPVWRAVQAHADIEIVLLAPALVAGSPAAQLAEDVMRARIPTARLSSSLFSRISERDGPTGVAAVVREPQCRLDDLAISPQSVVVVLDRVSNPGNLGSIIRTVDAAGASALILTGPTADPFSLASVKASMGSIFSVPIVRARSSDGFFQWAKRERLTVVTTSAHASKSLFAAAIPRPLAVVFGSEGSGLSPELLARGEHQLTIPMVGTASSLNLSVSVGVVLFQLQRDLLLRHGSAGMSGGGSR